MSLFSSTIFSGLRESQDEANWATRPSGCGKAADPPHWPLSPHPATRDVLTLHWGDEVIEQEVIVGSGGGAVSSLRTGKVMEMLLNPGEAPIRGALEVESVQISYPGRELSVWGWQVHWVILFFVFSFLFAFACKGFMGVEI